MIEIKNVLGAVILAVDSKTLRWADLRGANLCGADLRGADLCGADLRWATLRGSGLRGADLRWATLRGANLCGSDLRGANLRWADLRWAYLRGSGLRGADLRWATLRGSDLRGANLCGANLCGADLRGAYLREADLIGVTWGDLSSVPVVPHIDAAILAQIDAGGVLDMSDWHRCETTHCRAGWAITLAGAAGNKLEAEKGSWHAGALIYAASRPGVDVPDFFARDYEAMADMRAKAEGRS